MKTLRCPSRNRKRVITVVAVVCAIAAGCGSRSVRVTGTVSLDGKPLSKGMILLEPTDEGTDRRRAFGEIIDGQIVFSEGKYELRPGRYRVQLRSEKQTGRWITPGPAEPAVAETIELLPPRYHDQSQEVVELKPGENVLTYELQSK